MLLWPSSQVKNYVMDPNTFAFHPSLVKPFVKGAMVDYVVDDTVMVLYCKTPLIKIINWHCINWYLFLWD